MYRNARHLYLVATLDDQMDTLGPPLKLLHTSDWHLGVTHEDASCEPEQKRFLNWLIATIDQRQIDLLLITGDVFHYAQPSNSAQRLYYDFLLACQSQTALKKIVIIAGNHDSPSGLETPQQLLERFDIHVVGQLGRGPDERRQALIHVADNSDSPLCAIAAVPYVRAAQLGISGFDKPPADVRREFHNAFADLYREFADLAHQKYGEIPLVATGHLTCYGPSNDAQPNDYHTPIHRVGTIDHLSPEIFDPRFDYVALGHIHRPFPVEEGRIWYAGTPIPTTRTETPARFVIEVAFNDGQMDCNPIQIPRWRDIVSLEGNVADVLADFEAIDSDCEFSPHVFIHIQNDGRDYENPPMKRLYELRERFDEPKPTIVDYRESIVANEVPHDTEPPPQLDDLSPEDVFARMYRSRHENNDPDEALLRAFRQLLEGEEEEDERAQEPAEPSETTPDQLVLTTPEAT